MISANILMSNEDRSLCFSAIARSVMISAEVFLRRSLRFRGFSAIARSVMISAAMLPVAAGGGKCSFSAIARSVMISAAKWSEVDLKAKVVSVL